MSDLAGVFAGSSDIDMSLMCNAVVETAIRNTIMAIADDTCS